MRFLPLSQITVRPLEWLWLHRLAIGELGLLIGDPEMSKSLVTLDLTARVTTGRPFPDGSPGLAPANVILLNAEDSLAVLKARLEGMGADLDRVAFPQSDEQDAGPLPSFPRDLDLLDRELARTHARLVILDPVGDFLGRGTHDHSDQSVRRALQPLAALAARHQAVVLLVRHLNKDPRQRAIYRALGSIAFAGLCRSTWLIAADPCQPPPLPSSEGGEEQEWRRRILAQVKNNYAPLQPSLVFTVTSQPSGQPFVCWQGTSELGADNLLAGPPKPPPPPKPGERARDLLQAFLADGPRSLPEIWVYAAQHDLAKRTIQRAKDALGVRLIWLWIQGERIAHWMLRDQEIPAHIPPESVELDLAEMYEKLKRIQGMRAEEDLSP